MLRSFNHPDEAIEYTNDGGDQVAIVRAVNEGNPAQWEITHIARPDVGLWAQGLQLRSLRAVELVFQAVEAETERYDVLRSV